MGGFSDFWKGRVLDHLFGKGACIAPDIHVGLSSAEPGDDGSGLAEPAGGGYGRVRTTAADWNSAQDGTVSNAGGILFAPADSDWPQVSHVALFDAPTGGEMLAWGQLSVVQVVRAGDAPEFAAGDLSVSLD